MGWPLENLLSRLWETVEKSGVGLLKPTQIRRVGKAESEVAVERMLLIAAAEKQIDRWTSQPPDNLLITLKRDPPDIKLAHTRNEPTFDAEQFELEVNSAQKIDYLRREINVQKAVAQAEAVLQQDTSQPPEQTVDFDWFIRWRDYASLMSSEDLQNMWGSLLAGEVKAPGTFAYRTLDFLRNLSPDEARLVERMGALIVNNEMLFFGRGMILKKPKRVSIELPIHEWELGVLEELGILTGYSSMGYSSNVLPTLQADGKYTQLLSCGKRGLVALTDDSQKKVEVGFYGLTKLGRNVMKLVSTEADENYLLAVGNLLREDGFNVLLADVIELDGRTTFTNTVPLPESTQPPAEAA